MLVTRRAGREECTITYRVSPKAFLLVEDHPSTSMGPTDGAIDVREVSGTTRQPFR